MSSRALTGPKRMVVEIPSYNGEYDAGTGLWTGDNDWGGSGNAIFIDRFLDLSGYEKEGDPTTNSRLYVTRFVLASGPATPGATLTIPASRAILTGSVIEEPDLVYMQRLKRSYELQQL
jgi:hypothetical protein